jgi:hypothetical protein
VIAITTQTMTAYFTRHAYAFHNEFYGKFPDNSVESDDKYIDPGLSPSGINSICINRDVILSKLPTIDIVLMSPLKRAIQTGMYLYLDKTITPLFYITYALKEGKDISGSDPNTYQVSSSQSDDLDLTSFNMYKDIKYLDNKEIVSMNDRLITLKNHLTKFGDKNVLAITHSGILNAIFDDNPKWLMLYKISISKL